MGLEERVREIIATPVTRGEVMDGGKKAVIGIVALPILDRFPKPNGGEAIVSPDLPNDLPPHITYVEDAAESINGGATMTVGMKRGDILLLFSQKLGIMGNTYSVDSTNFPDRSMVVAVVASNALDVSFETFTGISVWKGREKTSRTSVEALAEDLNIAGEVQVTRAFIPGNCTPSGCASARLITAVAHKDSDGQVRYDLASDVVLGR